MLGELEYDDGDDADSGSSACRWRWWGIAMDTGILSMFDNSLEIQMERVVGLRLDAST